MDHALLSDVASTSFLVEGPSFCSAPAEPILPSRPTRKRSRRARKRGGEGAKPGLSADDYDPVLIVRDRHGATTDKILPNLTAETFDRELTPIYASRGEYNYEGFHIQNVNGYVSRLKGWMMRFRGVASSYLESYLGWRRLIERDDKRMTPRYVLAVAIGAR